MDNLEVALDIKNGLEKVIRKQIGELNANLKIQNEECSSILFTSTYTGEGKSTISLYLAISLSRSDKKTVWIDCNYHKRKTAYKIRNVKKEQEAGKNWGLLDYLETSCNLDEIIYPVNNEKLHVIPIGSVGKGAPELFEKTCFRELMTKLCEEYDYVILDSSAAGKYVDSKILASKCDGVVYVIEYNRVKKTLVKDTVENLKKCKGNILGAVINKSQI
ncbi:MAG TPA: hypothetical protein DCW90_24940 [Lachnospiraceae bacterium]|nr:CpsD/CapB family tyrosine-protein kinase [uncultured Lachnoclostridium sp.]HAU88601.1 hypothetical protein [Lachnospiraceae bacterium]